MRKVNNKINHPEKKLFFVLVATAVIFTLSAHEPNLCKDITGWNLKAGWSVTKDGTVGKAAVKLVRNVPSVFKVIRLNCTNQLKPGKKYVIRCDVKTDKVIWRTKETSGLTVGLEFWKGKKNISNVWAADVRGTKDWKTYSKEFTVPADFDRASLNVFLGRGRTGTAWIRNIGIYEVEKH